MAACRSCKAPVRWCSTGGGKFMPVNPEPVADGNLELVTMPDNTVHARVVDPAAPNLFGDPRWESHFRTCPDAATWRQDHGVPEPMRFDGATIDEDPDAPQRLTGQLLAVYDLLATSTGWWTLRELANCTGGSEASVSARLRDLRKPAFGAHTIDRHLVRKGLYQYRLHQEPQQQRETA